MFEKIMAARQKMEEIKKRLDTISVNDDTQGGAVKITATANRKITSIDISEDLLKDVTKEELEELLVVAVNRILEKAEKVSEAEMQAAARDILPGFPGV